MNKIFFTVGPAQLYTTVPKYIKTALEENIPSISHRSEQFSEIYKETSDNLRKLLQIPQTHRIFFISSALEAMERTIENTVYKDSFHFSYGSFSRKFYQTAVDLKKNAIKYLVPDGQGFDFTTIKIPKKSELITLVQNETSTGAIVPLKDIYFLRKQYPTKLIAVDIVSSAPYVQPDFSQIDIAFFSVQKGFGLPAGLGVLIVNDRAIEKSEWISKKGQSIGAYHNFSYLTQFNQKFQTSETPNVLNIYLLGKVAGDMIKTDIAKIRKLTDKKAAMIYNFFEEHETYNPFVTKPYRSQTTISIYVKENSDRFIKQLSKKGFIIAKGYGVHKDELIRIGNFPVHTPEQVKKLLENCSV